MVVQESEGLLLCGDVNVVLNRNMDITGVKNCKNSMTRLMGDGIGGYLEEAASSSEGLHSLFSHT